MARATATRVGFVGLGNIGLPMAERLLTARFELTVHDVDPEPVRVLAAAGARRAGSARELAAQAEVIGLCVRDDAQVREVSQALLAGAEPDTLLAIHSTIRPATVHEVARAAARRGVTVVDAPVTGGAVGARSGRLCVMVGGEPEAVERCLPVFEAFAEKVVRTGPLGSGAATKLCNNLMTYLGFLAAWEAERLAVASGLSRQALDEVGRHNGNLSQQKLAFLGLHRSPVDRSDPGFRAALQRFVELAEKDLTVTLDFARELGLELPGAALCREIVARVYGLEDPARD